MRFFFYGTLIDPDVRRAVLGRLAPVEAEPAVLRGWRRVPAAGKTYPVIVADPRGAVDGVVVRGLDRAARRRLERYEDDFYELIAVEVTLTGSGHKLETLVFAAGQQLSCRTARSWDLADWQRRHKRRFLATLRQRFAR